MFTGKTKSGFEFEVDPEVVKDIEFLELLGEAEGNPLKFGKMLDALFGKEQKKRLYDHVRNESGRALIDDVDREAGEILNILNESDETKN
jgi:hypothetical protein